MNSHSEDLDGMRPIGGTAGRFCIERRLLRGPSLALILAVGVGVFAAGLAVSSPKQTGPQGNGLPAAVAAQPASRALTTVQRFAPRGVYLVVDTARNRIYVRNGRRTSYTAVASTGSGVVLKDPRDPGRGWKFDTPRGVFTVTSKLTNPVWRKPDWAFIEEGHPIPDKIQDRLEAGVLGDYALGFGDGYFIHGTLYTRLLGTNVTHGCIRVGDDDLRYLFQTIPLGATVIIF
ncbi:MAG: L,D-transpeptidase [Nitrospirales bacterium]